MSESLKYPVILVHGMFGWGDDEGINNYLPYWGANTCNIVKHYRNYGYSIYAASVGPASSCWDRACELYARLIGGPVDYGKAHSDKHKHRRYGRYHDSGILEKWDKDHKIHLVGHSFGGNTVRMLAYLLTYGCPEEVEASPDDVSELFKGGHQDLIASVFTICTPHNGTTTFLAAEKFGLLSAVKTVAYNYMGIFGRSPAEGSIFDFHLEQYGLSDTPGKKDAYPIRRAKKNIKSSQDNIEYDMCPEGADKMNAMMKICPEIFYFSYTYNSVSVDTLGKHHIACHTDFPFLTFTSTLIMLYGHFFNKSSYNDFDDYANDGLVDLKSGLYPKTEPFKYFDKADVTPGVWNVMDTRVGDHGSPIGLLSDVNDTISLYDEILDLCKKAEETR